MGYTDEYIAAGAAHDANFERHHAPYNNDREYRDDPHLCDGCAEEAEPPAEFCDRCLVANSLECGDWWPESIAAFHRINSSPVTC
jgi:hypothetical protein